MFELVDDAPQNAVIKVIGVGGGGGNAVQHMVANNVSGVDFIATNTDAQALKGLDIHSTLQLGSAITKGLGAGADPEIGRQAATDDRDRIAELIGDADMLFITAGMGGGTGTGAAPVVAEVAKEMGVLTVAVVTKPFDFERRSEKAAQGIDELEQHVDSLITIPNEKLVDVFGGEVTFLNAFSAANDVLLRAVKGIADLIICPGVINVDFADVRTVMSEMGISMMGTGRASGEGRAREAAEKAIQSPLLEDIDLHGARGILINVTGNSGLGMGEFMEVGRLIGEYASPSATVVVGTVIDDNMEDELMVTVVATGLGQPQESQVVVENSAITRAVISGRKSYSALDTPAYERTKSGAKDSESKGKEPHDKDMDYLDVPAFLRRQAD